MALIFSPQFEATFSTDAGTSIRYKVELLRSYEDTGPTPDFVGNSVRDLVMDGQIPVTIIWSKDDNTYKPINSSRAQVNLWVQFLDQYDEFNSAGQFEWQLRIRSINADDTESPEWCGFINAVNSTTGFTTYPYTESFTALDGLGALENRSVNPPTSEDDIIVFDTILEGLQQTGLDLDVLVDSKIRSTLGDALTTSTSRAMSFINEAGDELKTYKEAIEGWLSAYNCTIKQSKGRYYIFNASTHGGDGDAETATFQRFSIATGATAYTANGTITEDLRYNLTSGADADVFASDDNFSRSTRRPNGSVECRPADLVPVQFVGNGDFSMSASGWDAIGSIDETLLLDDSAFTAGTQSITTNRNRFLINSNDEIWFKNTNPYRIDLVSPTTFSFDWLPREFNGVEDAQLRYQIYAVLDDAVSAVDVDFSDFSLNSVTRNRLYWLEESQRWDAEDNDFTNVGINTQTTTSQDEWQNVSLMLAPLTSYRSIFGGSREINGASLFVQFFYPQGDSTALLSFGTNRGDDTGEIRVNVDNIKVVNMFDDEIGSPVMERIQLDHTLTSVYEPLFANGIASALVQKIFPTTGFWRDGNTLEEATPLTLERVVTQLKLNDFRTNYTYYSGNLLNNTITPLGVHNKVLVNYVNGSESASCIISGGEWNLKGNRFNVYMSVPNQDTDVSPGDGVITDGVPSAGFYPINIDLIAGAFPGRSVLKQYVVKFDAVGLDDNGLVLDADPMMAGVQPAMIPSEPGTQELGREGMIINQKLLLTPADGFELRASNLSVVATTENPIPTYISFPTGSPVFAQVGDNVELAYIITIPSKSEYEVLTITGEVDPFIADNREYDLTFALDAGVGNAVIEATMRALRGPVGAVSFANVIIAPSAGHTLDASTFGVSGALPTGISLLGFSQLGTSIIGEFAVTFQAMNQVATISVNGVSGTALAGGVDTSVISFAFTEDISNVSIISNFSATGVVGSTSQFNVPLYAADGFTLTSGNFSASGAPGNITMYDAVGGGDSVQIPFRATFPTADQTASIIISGSAQEGGADTSTTSVTFIAGAGITLTETSETFVGVPGTSLPYTNDVIADSDLNITGISLGALTGDTGAVSLTASGTGDRGKVSGNILFGSSSQSVSVPVNATTAREPHNVRFVINSQTLTFAGSSMQEVIQGYDVGDGTFSFTIPVNSADEMEFTSSFLPVASFGATTDSNGNSASPSGFSRVAGGAVLSGENATITISGTFPSTTGIDLVVPIDITGEPIVSVATTGSISGDGDRILANDGTAIFTIIANGSWELDSTEGLIINDPSSSFSPSNGGAGTFTIVSTINVILINGRLVNGDGSEDTTGATSGTAGFALRPFGESSTLATGSNTWSSIGGSINDAATVDGISIVVGPAGSVPNTLYFT